LPFFVSEESYWLDGGLQLIELKRKGGEPPKLIDPGKYASLVGIHGSDLIVQDDKGIHALPMAGGTPTKRFDVAEGMSWPVVVGDRLVMSGGKDDKDFLHHAPMAGGEFTTLELSGKVVDRPPAVRGDSMLLILDCSKVVRISGDMSKTETLYELGADVPNQFISDVAFVGDAIAFVVGEVDDDPTLTLVRQGADGTRSNLQDVPADSETLLIGDGERAYFQVRDKGTWLIDAQTIQQVDLGGWTLRLAGTSAGLAWHVDSEIRLAIAGTPGPELPKEAFSEAFDFSGGLGLGKRPVQVTGSTKTIGAMDTDMVRRIARAHSSEVRKCHTKGKKSNPQLSGSIALSFTINADGTVSDVAAVEGPNSTNEALVSCLVAAVGTWKFPKPGRGGTAKVVHTIGFGDP
jgi:hypothetical protein